MGSSKHHYATAHGVSLEAIHPAAEHMAPSTTKCADRRGHHPEKRASLFAHDASTFVSGRSVSALRGRSHAALALMTVLWSCPTMRLLGLRMLA